MVTKLDVYVVRFEEWMQVKGFSERTIEDYRSNVRQFLNYLLEECAVSSIQEIDRQRVHSYQNYLYSVKTKGGKRLKLESQHKKLVAVRSFFRFLLSIEAVLFNPAASIKLPKKGKKLPAGVLSEQQVELVLEMPDTCTPLGFRDRTIMETLYATAIRNTELRELTVYDVDADQMRLTVHQGKNAKDRVVPLGEIACDYLREYLVTIRPQLCRKLSLTRGKNDSDQNVLFVSKNGRQITQDNLVRIVQKYVKKLRDQLGASDSLPPKISPHSFRHSCAAHMLKHGADIRYIQELLGHASVATTQIYTRVEEAELKAVHRKCHPRERFNDDYY